VIFVEQQKVIRVSIITIIIIIITITIIIIISQIMKIRSKYKSELESMQNSAIQAFPSTAFLVNDQSVYYLMMTVLEKKVHGISLDYGAKMFLNM
jgi:uncharacterized protein YpmB